MALLLVQPGAQPAGQFDLKKDEVIIGGQVGVFDSIALVNGFQTIAIRRALPTDTAPFFLLDDGLAGYGVNFGTTVTKTSTGFTDGMDFGLALGPPTYAGSNKVTLWDKPGLYAVTLNALADDEATLKAAAPGTGLTVDTSGKLKLGNTSSIPIAYVIQYKVEESLVVTTATAAANKRKLIIYFNPTGEA
jgi:hypothetical protein